MKAEWERTDESSRKPLGRYVQELYVWLCQNMEHPWYWSIDINNDVEVLRGCCNTRKAAEAAAEAALDAMIAELAAKRGYKLVKEGNA